MALKQDGVHFVLCPKQGIGIIELFCPLPKYCSSTPPAREGGARFMSLGHDVSRIEEEAITLLVFYDCFCVRILSYNSFTEPSSSVGASLFRL